MLSPDHANREQLRSSDFNMHQSAMLFISGHVFHDYRQAGGRRRGRLARRVVASASVGSAPAVVTQSPRRERSVGGRQLVMTVRPRSSTGLSSAGGRYRDARPRAGRKAAADRLCVARVPGSVFRAAQQAAAQVGEVGGGAESGVTCAGVTGEGESLGRWRVNAAGFPGRSVEGGVSPDPALCNHGCCELGWTVE